MQPIHVWGHWGAPNPWKVRMLLDELELSYTWDTIELDNTKSEEHIKLNPNGRLPTIQDPNTGMTLWETGAIILYLIDTYDKSHKLSYPDGSKEKFLCQQWLAFQISGQGPYTGQATWFARFHPGEKMPSAIDRYVNEMIRVIGVLELGLERSGSGWLVGEKLTYADLSFVTWALVGEGLLVQLGKKDEAYRNAPRYVAWLEAMKARPVVGAALEEIRKGRQAHGLP